MQIQHRRCNRSHNTKHFCAVNKLRDRFGESRRRKVGALRAPDDESSNFSWHRRRDNVFIFRDLLLDDGVGFASQK